MGGYEPTKKHIALEHADNDIVDNGQKEDMKYIEYPKKQESGMEKNATETEKTDTLPKNDDVSTMLKLKATKLNEKIETPMERLKRLENAQPAEIVASEP